MKPLKLSIIALDENSYHVFLTLKVDDIKCRFLLDTGASKTVIDKNFVSKLGTSQKMKTLKKETRGLNSTEIETAVIKIKSFFLNELEIKNHLFAAIDLSHVNHTYKSLKKPIIHGILGSDILLEVNAVIDYGKKQLSVFTKKSI
jgi:hypothetical protein